MSRITAAARLTLPESAQITVSVTMDVRTARLIHQQILAGDCTRYEASRMLNALAGAVALATTTFDAEQKLDIGP